jgi:hypothetical protein
VPQRMKKASSVVALTEALRVLSESLRQPRDLQWSGRRRFLDSVPV